MVARVGVARKWRAAARWISAGVTAFSLATVGRDHAAEHLHLARQLLDPAAGAFQRHQQAGFHLGAGAGEFGVRHLGLHLAQFLQRDGHQFLGLAFAGAGIDAEQAAIHIGRADE